MTTKYFSADVSEQWGIEKGGFQRIFGDIFGGSHKHLICFGCLM